MRKRQLPIVSLVAVCALGAAVGGCGGGSDEAASVARDYLEARAARDADTACALLTEEGLADEFETDTGDGDVDACVSYIEALPGDGFEVGEVSVVDETEGGAAIVHAETDLDPEPTVMVLVESDGEWLIEDAGYDSATEAPIE